MAIKPIFVLILIVLAFNCSLASALIAPETEWNRTFGGNNSDEAYSVQQSSDGGFIIAGSTRSFGAGESDFWLIKTDSNGNEEWNKTFGGPYDDWFAHAQQTFDNGYIIAGNSQSSKYGKTYSLLIKTDSNGNEQWNKTFDGLYTAKAYSVQQSSDGGFIIVGLTAIENGNGMSWLLKTDSNGNEEWNKVFGAHTGYSTQQTSDSGYIISGSNKDIWLIKTDSNGNEEWSKTFEGLNLLLPNYVRQTSDNGYIIAAYSPLNYVDFLLIKTDSNGNTQWNKIFDDSSTEFATSVQQTFDGGYIAVGHKFDILQKYLHIWLIKLKDTNDIASPLVGIITPTNGSTITINSTWLNVTTNQIAFCTFGEQKCPTNEPMLACQIGSVTNISTSNGTFHFKEISLENGYTYSIDIRCTDTLGNFNTQSTMFYVAFPQPAPGGGGGGDSANTSNTTRPDVVDLKIISPQNNSVISENSLLLQISSNKYASCSYSLDSGIFTGLQEAEETTITLPPGITVEGDAWQVQTANHLELSEDGSNTDTIETIRNITTYIGKNNLKALSSGSVTNSKTTSPYNQYLYLLGPGAGNKLGSGFVIYTEDDNDITADFLYFKSGTEIGRYLFEFTTALESDVDDSTGSASTTGLFLTDYQDVDIKLFGKKYTIVTAKRTSTVGNNVILTLMNGAAKDTLIEKQTKTYTISGIDYEVTLNFVDNDEAQFVVNGQTTRKMKDGDTDKLSDGTTIGVTDVLYQDYAGGIHSATFFLGVNKLELRDTDITDFAPSNSLKIDDNSIDEAQVIIEGTDNNSTFKITRIHVNMTADDNFFVPANGKLSETIKDEGGSSAEPEVLFTENWDIEYKGLKSVNTEKIKLVTSGSSQYNLEFVDGDGYKVSVPIAKAIAPNSILFGDLNKAFINRENLSINKDDYFVVTDGSRKRGERKTYILQYKGADKSTADNPVLKFKKMGEDKTIEQTYSAGTSGGENQLATLKIGGADFKVYNTSSIASNDFPLRIDLDATTPVGGAENLTVNITTRYGAEIGLDNITDGMTNNIILSIKTPDDKTEGNAKDSWENLRSIDFAVNIISDLNSKVTHSKLWGYTSGQKGQQLNLRTPAGRTNIEYGYTSYGTFITREMPTSEPATFEIDYPESQRYPMVYITTKGTTFGEPDETINSQNKNKWKVGTSNHLELGEDGVASDTVETLRNITTFIDKNNLNALGSGIVANSKATSPYNQYLYVLGPGTESSLDTGYTIFTESDDDVTADFLYFKSGKEIGRHLIEFTTPFESGIYDNSGMSSSTGLFLNDFEGVNITLFGKKFTISNAKRTSADGNGVELTLNGDDKLELKDTNISDVASTNSLKVNDNAIDEAYVIIEGTDNSSTFKIIRIHVNMTADDNYFVKAGGRLSDAIIQESGASAEPEVLFTQNWDIAYLGLSNFSSEKIKLVNYSINPELVNYSLHQYNLEFVDGNGDLVIIPIASSQRGNEILMGGVLLGAVNRSFTNINSESLSIPKGAYFAITDSSRKRGERPTFVLRYEGADKVTNGNPVIKFNNLGSGQTIELAYTNSSPLATLNIEGANYKIYAADDPTRAGLLSDDFDIRVDMDGDNILNNDINSNIVITTQFGAEINITNQTGSSSILLIIKTPDDGRDGFAKDSVENLYPSILAFEITANSGVVNHEKLGNLRFRNPNGALNTEYAYTSYGAFVKRETPVDGPATLDIDYPSSQRLPLVYYETGGTQSKLLENLAKGDHTIIVECNDIFDNSETRSLNFFVDIPPNITDFSTIGSVIQTFLNNTKFFYFVVGDTAPAEDVIAVSDIIASWQYQPIEDCGFIEDEPVCIRRIKLGAAKLASEIQDPYNTNVVSVGKPHNNAITNLFLPSSLWPLDTNTGLISRFVHNGTATLIVAGNTDLDTRRAAKVIAEFRDYNLNRTCFEVNTSDKNNLILSGCNLSKYNIDTDHDSILDREDNCKNTPNPDQSDLDKDGLGDICDSDNDNDGINNTEDRLLGNSSNINTSSINPIVEIDNSTDLNLKFNETHSIKIKNSNKTIAEFEYNFSNDILDLRNISIDIQINSTNGMTLFNIKGMPIIGTKTLYIDNLNNLTTLCIKDEEITSITQVSSLCNGANEYGIKCPGTANNDRYNCTFADETNQTFKITGLTHSGVQQQSYCGDGIVNSGEDCSNCPSDAGNCPSTGGGGSSGTSGGGGGGGGGSAGFVCNMDWQCGDWSACINSVQTRQCAFVKVPQHVQETQCPEESKSPETSRSCQAKAEAPVTAQAVSNSTIKETSQPLDETAKSQKEDQGFLSSITGGAISSVFSNPKAVREIVIGAIALIVIAAIGIIGYQHVYKKK